MESFLEIKEKFTFSIPDMINDIMMSLSDEIIELNQVEQLSEGIDALGQKIRSISAKEQGAGEVYSYWTIYERSAEGLQTDKVDLNFTGVFWKTFKVRKVSKGWEVQVDYRVHNDDIRENFESKYDFAGLTDANLEYLVETWVIPQLDKRILKQVGL